MPFKTAKIVWVLGVYCMVSVVRGWHALIDLEEYLRLTSNANLPDPNANSSTSQNATADASTNSATPAISANNSTAAFSTTKSSTNFPSLVEPTKELLELAGTRFSILRKKVTWTEAVVYCQSHSLRLVSLPLLEDAKSLIEAIAKLSQPYFDGYEDAVKKYEFGMDRRYWIGLTDMVVEGDWEWITEGYSLRYNDMWYAGQPDHSRQISPTPEHCAALWNPGYEEGDTHTFNDDVCTKKYYAICGEQPPFLFELLKQRDVNNISDDKLKTVMKKVKKPKATKTVPVPPPPPPHVSESSEDKSKSSEESKDHIKIGAKAPRTPKSNAINSLKSVGVQTDPDVTPPPSTLNV